MIQNHFISSCDNSEFEIIVFDDEPFCKDDDDKSNMFDNELYNSTKINNNRYEQT